MIAMRDEDLERLRSRNALGWLLAASGWFLALSMGVAVYAADLQAETRGSQAAGMEVRP